MNVTRAIQIRSEARELLAECWKDRAILWPKSAINLGDFLIYAPEKIVTQMFQLRLSVVRRIQGDIHSSRGGDAEIVGILDRPRKEIVISQSRGFEEARFTLAHEIGHFRLHPGLNFHRERSMDFSADLSTRSPIEREADLFGAELLMPSKLVREYFLDRFKGVVDREHAGEATFYWLTRSNRDMDAEAFFADDPRYRSLQLATSAIRLGDAEASLSSLSKIFGVSGLAMAIQLCDLGLVK